MTGDNATDPLEEWWEGEWHVTIKMPIEEIRLLYGHVCYGLEVWPGSPARPAEEQEYLLSLKSRLASMLMQHSFDTLDMG
jgi:hypothetical protein